MLHFVGDVGDWGMMAMGADAHFERGFSGDLFSGSSSIWVLYR
jgi:hypothetical protein